MFKKEYFRIFLISLIFSLSVLVSLPRIPFEVDNFWFTTVSYIGGYEFKIPSGTETKTYSLNNFKLGLDIGGGNRVTIKLDNPDSNVRDRAVSIITKRIQSAGINDFKINLSSEDLGTFSIDTPQRVSLQRIALLVSGNGDFVFKQINPSLEWNPDNFQKYLSDETAWEVADITEKDVTDIVSFVNTYGQNSIQMTFSDEGVKKFRDLAKNNIGKPIGFYINGLQFPFSMSLISEAVALDTGNSIAFSGGFQKEAADDFILQRKFPFSENLEVVAIDQINPKVETGSLLRYGLAFLVGVFLSLIYLTIRFKYLGLLHGISLITSLAFFTAILKILSVEIGIPSILGILALTLYLTDAGFNISKKIKTDESLGKPIDLVLFQVLDKEKELIRAPMLFTFVLMMVLYPFSVGLSKYFALVLALGMLLTMYFYPFAIRSLVTVFRGEKKGEKK